MFDLLIIFIAVSMPFAVYLCQKNLPEGKGFFTWRRIAPPLIMLIGMLSALLLFALDDPAKDPEIRDLYQAVEVLSDSLPKEKAD